MRTDSSINELVDSLTSGELNVDDFIGAVQDRAKVLAPVQRA
jgi:hypothetical protein